MRWLSIILIVAATLGVTGSGLRADNEARLDDLFDALQRAETVPEARRAERRIWAHWLAYNGDSDTVDRHMRQGALAQRAGDVDLAERSFERAIEADPSYAEAWNRRATIRWIRGNFQGSINDIAATLALEPRHFGALTGLGDIMLRLDDLERAAEIYERALAVNPHMDDVEQRLDWINARLNDRRI